MAEAFSDISFTELEISDEIKRAVVEMGFEKMTPIQAQAIPALLSGRDIIGQAQTGTGKTAAFGIPVLQRIDPDNRKLQAVILCPTRELAVQATNEIRNFAKFMQGVKVLPVYGGQDIRLQIKNLKGVQVIVGTPGRVMDHMRRHTIKMKDVSMVVLDEADEMLNMGFREDMEFILGAIEQEHQTCLFSATMPKEILALTDQFQKSPFMIKITRKELTMDRIKQYYYPVKSEYKTLALNRLLKYHHYKKSVIFCNTKGMVDELAASLQKEGYAAAGLHGDLTQKQRDSVMGRFRSGSVHILIATDIAARGIDVDDVEAVFNYDIPQEIEYYVHRIGRTGRAGREGASHTLCRSRDFKRIRLIENVCHSKMQERKIPSVKEIIREKEQHALEAILEVWNEGESGDLISIVADFCEKHDISIDAFAAACLRKELGEGLEEAEEEINLAERPARHRDGRRGDGKRDGRDGRRGDRRRDGRDGRRGDGKRDGRNGRSGDGRRDGRNGRRGNDKYIREDRREGRGEGWDNKHNSANKEKKHSFMGKKEKDVRTTNLKKEERKAVKKKNREVSIRELQKAVQDIRFDVPPKKKK